MKAISKLCAYISIIGVSSLYAQNVGSDAPSFSMYQYKNKTFSTDTVYKKKIFTFVFGSIT